MRNDLKDARIALDLTQTQVAELIGKSQSDVSRYESGQTEVDRSAAPKLAAALGLPLIQVLYGPNFDQAAA